jgi:hypothetical protein
MKLFKKRLLPDNKLFRVFLPIAVLAAAGILTALEITNSTDLLHGPQPQQANINSPALEDSIPDEKEGESPQAPKPGGTSDPGSGTGTASQKKKVTPEITSVRQASAGSALEIRAFIPKILEEGGTCMATLTRGASKVSGSSSGFVNVSHTTCRRIEIPAAEFPAAGNWTLTVSYKSSTSEGASAAQTVEVQK